MGWLKSNWLDALIFLLVAVIMAGVVFFLTGVNPLNALRGSQQPPSPVVTQPTQTPKPQTTPTTQPETPPSTQPETTPSTKPQTTPSTKPETTPSTKPQTTPTTQPATTPSISATKPQTQTTKPSTTSTSSPTKPQAKPTVSATQPDEPGEQTITLIPQADSNQPAAKPVPAPPKVNTTVQNKPTTTVNPTPQPAVQPVEPTPRVSPTADPSGNWRIAVGSFSDEGNAARLADTLRAKGYPVSLEPAGGNTRVWVGPYGSSAKARAVAGSLGGYSPQVARIVSPQTSASSSDQTPTPTPVTSAPTSGYLQAGAFRNQQNAQDLVAKIQQAGFAATVSEGNGIYRVRVGPVEDTAAAKSALGSKGIQAVEVR